MCGIREITNKWTRSRLLSKTNKLARRYIRENVYELNYQELPYILPDSIVASVDNRFHSHRELQKLL